MRNFDFVTVGNGEDLDKEIETYRKTGFEVQEKIAGFDGLKLEKMGKFPFVNIVLKSKDVVAILRNVK